MRTIAPLLLFAASLPATASAQEEPAPKTRPLAEVIAGSHLHQGLLTFHHDRDVLRLELPDSLLGAELGFSALLVNAVGDWSVRGSSLDRTQVVRWDRRGERLVLSKVNTDFRASPESSLSTVVASSFPDSPVFQADLIPLSDDPAPLLIDASGLFGPELVEILPESTGFSTKPEAATLVSLKTFPDNVVARVSYRFQRDGKVESDDGSPMARFVGPGRLADERNVEVTVDYHFFRLPEDGYRPRFADERIGAMTLSYKDYDGIDQRDSAFRHVLLRWDVRKADPDAEVSPPVEPITFWVDRGVPDEWRPLVHEATLWWNDAFERVGIENAVQVLDQPDDPDWDPADIHHSMIYWNLSDDLIFSGLAGPMFSDPRTGQVLRSNVYLNAEFPSYTLHRYLVYSWWRAPSPAGAPGLASPGDVRNALRALRGRPWFCDRAASFSSQIAFARLVLQSRGVLRPGTPEATRYAREAFRELVAHEVGHALGFPHDWKASLASSFADLTANRATGSVAKGPVFSSSVMDYDPIYLAPRGQPQGDYYLTEVGPYDRLAVEYFYRPFDGATAEEEALALDAIAARAEVEPGLIFDAGGLGDIDPTTNADDLGDDPVAFAESRLAIMREEVLPRLSDLVVAEGHDYGHVRQALDAAVFSVAMDYVDILARHVGGQVLLRRVAGSPAALPGGPPPVRPVEAETQRRALAVLGEHVFAEGALALPPEVLATLEPDMLPDWNYPWRYESDYDLGARVRGIYRAALDTLLEPARLARVLDNERRVPEGSDRFTLPELFETLEQETFGDVGPERPFQPVGDRRALQVLLVERLTKLAFEPDEGTPTEASQLARTSLRRIGGRLSRVRVDGDAYAAAQREDLRQRIERLLDARIQVGPTR